MADNSTSPPPPVLNPAFAAIETDDHRGYLWIATILSLIFVALTLSARIYVRKHMLGRDDFASIAAVALAFGQWVTLFAGMPSGLGTSKTDVVRGNSGKNGSIFLTSQGLFICGMYMAKFAVLLATERLLAANMKTVRKICIMLRAVLGVAAVASLLIVTISCRPGGLLATGIEKQCSGQGWRWTVVSIVDGVTEAAVLATFYGLIWSLQMSTKLKSTLTILLGLRIVCPVFTGIYTSQLKAYVGSSDPAVSVISALVWQQVSLGYSLMAALLIALMPFLKSFHTGMVMNVNNMTTAGSSSGGPRSREFGYAMHNLSKNSKQRSVVTSAVRADDEEALASSRWADAQPRQTSSRSKGDSDSGDSLKPDQMVIQKTVNWSVQYEDRGEGQR